MKFKTKSDFPSPDWAAALFHDIHNLAHDAEVAIIAQSLIERAMQVRLRKELIPDMNSELDNRLFKGRGPFDGFSACADVCYALGLFDNDIYKDLRSINFCRNALSHRVEKEITFEDEFLSSIFTNLRITFTNFRDVLSRNLGAPVPDPNSRLWDVVFTDSSGKYVISMFKLFRRHSEREPIAESETTPRDKFILSAGVILAVLLMQSVSQSDFDRALPFLDKSV